MQNLIPRLLFITGRFQRIWLALAEAALADAAKRLSSVRVKPLIAEFEALKLGFASASCSTSPTPPLSRRSSPRSRIDRRHRRLRFGMPAMVTRGWSRNSTIDELRRQLEFPRPRPWLQSSGQRSMGANAAPAISSTSPRWRSITLPGISSIMAAFAPEGISGASSCRRVGNHVITAYRAGGLHRLAIA